MEQKIFQWFWRALKALPKHTTHFGLIESSASNHKGFFFWFFTFHAENKTTHIRCWYRNMGAHVGSSFHPSIPAIKAPGSAPGAWAVLALRGIQNSSPSRLGHIKCGVNYNHRNKSAPVTIPTELSAGKLRMTKRKALPGGSREPSNVGGTVQDSWLIKCFHDSSKAHHGPETPSWAQHGDHRHLQGGQQHNHTSVTRDTPWEHPNKNQNLFEEVTTRSKISKQKYTQNFFRMSVLFIHDPK